jgi:LPXTG-motif cell wall-anchored protein
VNFFSSDNSDNDNSDNDGGDNGDNFDDNLAPFEIVQPTQMPAAVPVAAPAPLEVPVEEVPVAAEPTPSPVGAVLAATRVAAPAQAPAQLPRTGDGSSLPRDNWRLDLPPQVVREVLGDDAAPLLLDGGVEPGTPVWDEVQAAINRPNRLPNTGGQQILVGQLAMAALALIFLAVLVRFRLVRRPGSSTGRETTK